MTDHGKNEARQIKDEKKKNAEGGYKSYNYESKVLTTVQKLYLRIQSYNYESKVIATYPKLLINTIMGSAVIPLNASERLLMRLTISRKPSKTV